MYISSYRSRAAQLSVKTAVLNHYMADDIFTARQMIEDSVKMIVPDHTLVGKRRTDSVNRSASDAMMDDILEFFKAYDRCDEDDVPKFVCSDAARLPPAAPEAAGNLMVALEALATQQRQIKQLQESMSSMRIDIEDVKVRTNDSEGSIKALTENVAERLTPLRGYKQNHARKSEAITPNKDKKDNMQPAEKSSKEPQQITEDPVPSTSKGDGTYSAALQAQVENDDGFSRPRKRPNKGTTKGNSNQPARMLRKGGTSDSDILKGGPDTFQMQITNVNATLDETKIKDYINSKGTEVTKVEDTSSGDWDTKRFLLTFEFSKYDQVMATEFWPKRIFFRRWFPARVKKGQ